MLINDQETASLHFITKCDTVGRASVACWTSGGSPWHGSCDTGRDILSHGTGAGVEGSGGICRRIQDLDTHWDHTKRLCRLLVCNTPEINKTIFKRFKHWREAQCGLVVGELGSGSNGPGSSPAVGWPGKKRLNDQILHVTYLGVSPRGTVRMWSFWISSIVPIVRAPSLATARL